MGRVVISWATNVVGRPALTFSFLVLTSVQQLFTCVAGIVCVALLYTGLLKPPQKVYVWSMWFSLWFFFLFVLNSDPFTDPLYRTPLWYCLSFYFSQKILTVSLLSHWKTISRAAGKHLEIMVIVSITASYWTEFEESFLYLESRA